MSIFSKSQMSFTSRQNKSSCNNCLLYLSESTSVQKQISGSNQCCLHIHKPLSRQSNCKTFLMHLTLIQNDHFSFLFWGGEFLMLHTKMILNCSQACPLDNKDCNSGYKCVFLCLDTCVGSGLGSGLRENIEVLATTVKS